MSEFIYCVEQDWGLDPEVGGGGVNIDEGWLE